MIFPKLNPEVYRLAAELLEERVLNSTGMPSHFSCDFIRLAGRELGLDWQGRAGHVTAFTALFGPWQKFQYATGSSGAADIYPLERKRVHPFWDKPATEERQAQRVLSLLMMAETVSK